MTAPVLRQPPREVEIDESDAQLLVTIPNVPRDTMVREGERLTLVTAARGTERRLAATVLSVREATDAGATYATVTVTIRPETGWLVGDEA